VINLLIDLLKKTKLTNTIRSDSKYYANAGPARREGQASIQSLVSFGSQEKNNILPGSNQAPATAPPAPPAPQLGIWNLIVPNGETCTVTFTDVSGTYSIPVTGPINENNCLFSATVTLPGTVTKISDSC
jgi:hypothetical protein